MITYHVSGLFFHLQETVYWGTGSLPVTEKAPIKKASSPYGKHQADL